MLLLPSLTYTYYILLLKQNYIINFQFTLIGKNIYRALSEMQHGKIAHY